MHDRLLQDKAALSFIAEREVDARLATFGAHVQ